MVVEVTEGAGFKAGVPRPLFQAPLSSLSGEAIQDVFRWDVSADGKRFLIDTAKSSSEPLTILLNWTTDLKRR